MDVELINSLGSAPMMEIPQFSFNTMTYSPIPNLTGSLTGKKRGHHHLH
jgi:hypothetical protein